MQDTQPAECDPTIRGIGLGPERTRHYAGRGDSAVEIRPLAESKISAQTLSANLAFRMRENIFINVKINSLASAASRKRPPRRGERRRARAHNRVHRVGTAQDKKMSPMHRSRLLRQHFADV
eukprot:scaffold82518_cov30-Tisochrysis_lutea.AAC.1